MYPYTYHDTYSYVYRYAYLYTIIGKTAGPLLFSVLCKPSFSRLVINYNRVWIRHLYSFVG